MSSLPHFKKDGVTAADESETAEAISIERRSALDRRLAHARSLWRLSPRQTETLRALVVGLTNKEIAQQHRCSEVTVEFHVTALLRRAGVDSRSRAVAKFWLGLDLD
jgi:DNA-binding NarL/FixJ family response regulator